VRHSLYLIFCALCWALGLYSAGVQAKGGEHAHGGFQQSLAAALGGDAQAQYKVSWLYSQGRGVAVDHYKSIQWLEKAAAQGLAVAQYDLGQAWLGGYAGARADSERGLEWLRKAAEQGHLRAQMSLARHYRLGLGGVPRDVARSNLWLKRAAEQGDTRAQQLLGVGLVQQEDGRTRSGDAGYAWLQRAATQGDQESLFMLGAMHFRGRGAQLDYVKARAYIQLSALLIERKLTTYAEAELVRERRETVAFLSRNMSQQQIDASRTLVREWVTENPQSGIDQARIF